MRTGADYIQGVWVRLNGGGRRLAGIAGLPTGLVMPPVNKEARAAATKALSLEISSLEKRLQESSKVQACYHVNQTEQAIVLSCTRPVQLMLRPKGSICATSRVTKELHAFGIVPRQIV